MNICKHRGGLQKTLEALKKARITLGFIGGSITDGRPEWNWPEPVCAWFVDNFPGVRVTVENAAIGATGSDLAVFRAERDLIQRGCDLVFVEFAVNDEGAPVEQRLRSREGLIRKLLKGPGRDVVLTYTYSQPMYTAMLEGKMPATIAEFEQIADHYALGSVWMGLHALQEVQTGQMRWEEWLPDGLHPQFRGSLSYAESVIEFLEKELFNVPIAGQTVSLASSLSQMGQSIAADSTAQQDLPAPLDPFNWGTAHSLPFEQIRLQGPWQVVRWLKQVWIDQVLHTAAPGASLAFEFEGRGLVLGFDFGKSSSEFRYRLDAGEWKLSVRDRPDWMGNDGWYRTYILPDELQPGRHSFELEVLHGNPTGDYSLAPRCSGTNCNLALVGVIS